jgi:hypothetical protein
MALNLMEKAANKKDCPAVPQTSNRKRTWSASNRSEHDCGGGGGRGGSIGGSPPGNGKHNRATEKSRKWPEVRRGDGPRNHSDGGYGGGCYGGGGSWQDNRSFQDRYGSSSNSGGTDGNRFSGGCPEQEPIK